MHCFNLFFAGLATLLLSFGTSQAVEIAVIGDSTVATYEADAPRRGWGQMLPEFLNPAVTIRNEAERGKSTRSFPPNRWKSILAAHSTFVLIQFGHNDQHADYPLADYQSNLRKFILEAREAKITPILVTPMHRRTFANGQVTTELAPYANAMKELGAEMKVPVIDLYEKSGVWFQELGDKGAEAFTVNFSAGGAKEDRTHFNEAGARQLARIVTSSFAEADPELAKTLKSAVSETPKSP